MLGPEHDNFFPRIGDKFEVWYARVDGEIKEINTRGRHETRDDNSQRRWDNYQAILACKSESRAAMQRLLLTIDGSTQRGEDIAYGDILVFNLLVPIVGGVSEVDRGLISQFEAVRGADVFKPAPGYEPYYHGFPRGEEMAPPPPADRPAPPSFVLRREPSAPPQRGVMDLDQEPEEEEEEPDRESEPEEDSDQESEPEEVPEEEKEWIEETLLSMKVNLAPSMEEECPVCKSEVSDAAKTTCGHIFCYGCLEDWLLKDSKSNCPLCRTDIELLF